MLMKSLVKWYNAMNVSTFSIQELCYLLSPKQDKEEKFI